MAEDTKKTEQEIRVVPVDEIQPALEKVQKDVEEKLSGIRQGLDEVRKAAEEAKALALERQQGTRGREEFDWEAAVDQARKAIESRSYARILLPPAGIRTVTSDDMPSLAVAGPYPGPRFPEELVDAYVVRPLTANDLRIYRESAASYGSLVSTVTTAAAANGSNQLTVASVAGFVANTSIRVEHHGGGYGTYTVASIDAANSKLTLSQNLSDSVDVGARVQSLQTIAALGEATQKPEGYTGLEAVDYNARTIPLLMPVSETMLKTVPAFKAWVQHKLAYKVRKALAWHLLYGHGTGNELMGYSGDSAVPQHLWSEDPSGSNRVDAVLLAANEIPSNGTLIVVMNRYDWGKILTLKGSDGHYLLGKMAGPVTYSNEPGRRNLNGMPVVLSEACAIGHFFVLSMDGVELYMAQQGELLWGYVGDQFAHNVISARYEITAIHAITVPQLIRKGEWDAQP